MSRKRSYKTNLAARSFRLLWPVVLLAALLWLVCGCTGTEITRGTGDPTGDGDIPDGDPDGSVPDGDESDGDGSDGDKPDGDGPDGDAGDGDAPDGDLADGDVPDGDISDGDVPDGDLPDGDQADGDLPDGDETDLCACVDCGPCNVCDPLTGSCVCTGDCETEMYCDGLDDDCNGLTDEGGVCDGRGLRIELSWVRSQADMDLHLLRPRGIFGTGTFIDYNSAYYANPSPDWGVRGNISDDPQYQGDVTAGSGEDNNPETILLFNPPPQSFRVLVHYSRRSGVGGQDSMAWVKIWMDGELKETFAATLNSANTFWNVACINYATKTVTPILTSNNQPEIVTGDLTQVNARACLAIGSECRSVCDCPPGAACIDAVCQPTEEPVLPCCSNWNCPAGSACENHNGQVILEIEGCEEYPEETGLCGSYLTFDRDPAGNAISAGASVETIYLPWGVRFSTPRANSVVSADAYRVSEGNSCATRDNDGTRWRGNVHVELFMPGDDGEQPVKAETHYAAFLVGDTRVSNGLRVSAFSLSGEKLSEQMVSGSTFASGIHAVRVVTHKPFHSLRIETVQDPDFAIDNLQIGPLQVAR